MIHNECNACDERMLWLPIRDKPACDELYGYDGDSFSTTEFTENTENAETEK